MKGAVLEKSELAYLLATLHATSIIGVDDPALFPVEESARDATFEEGRKQLQAHGWLKPVDNTHELNLNDSLLYMVAIVADPEFVVFTVRNTADQHQQLFLHYLAGQDIVELSALEEGQYRLLMVPDRMAMLQRIQEILGLPDSQAAPSVQFTIDEPVFLTIQDLVEHGKRDQAASLLKERGVNGANGESLLLALQSADSGNLIVVVRPRGGQIVAGRKATVFRQQDITWLTRRVDAETNTLKVETVQADTLPTILNNYLEYLSK